MRAVIQRVSHAQVTVEDEQGQQVTTGAIQQGLMVLIGVGPNDTEAEAKWLAKKLAGLRVFEDEQKKMNLSVLDVGGSILAVSQFTLYGDCRKGRRPAFTGAAHPSLASPLFDQTVELIRAEGVPCETGRFGASMQVTLLNQGPVTLIIDTEQH